MDFSQQIFSFNSLYFVGFGVLVTLQLTSVFYTLFKWAKPMYVGAFIALALPWLHCIVHGLSFTTTNIAACVLMTFVIYSTTFSLSFKISKIARSVNEEERDTVFGRRD